MSDFRYLTKKQAKPIREELCKIIHEVQDRIGGYFTFQFRFIGSSSYNMITYNKFSNIGFDFDVNIEVNDDNEDYEPYEIREIIRKAIDEVAPNYGYRYCEDSTSVLTIKKVNRYTCRILYSCDFALVYNCSDGRQQYIRFNKKSNTYTWEYRGGNFTNLTTKIKWLKDNRYWGELRDYYLDKKNLNSNLKKKSRSIFAESINDMYHKKRG